MQLPNDSQSSDTANKEVPQRVDAELIDAEKLAAMLSVSQRTLYRLKRNGYLPTPIRLGGSVRWRKQDVCTWIEAGCPKQEN